MTWLGVLLMFKIATTALIVVAPLLLLPPARLAARLAVPAAASGLARLYGVALLALLVGYGGGLVQTWQGVFPEGVVWMGLVSNGGATIALLATGWAHRHPALTALFGAIALGLAGAALFPDHAMGPL